MLKILISFLLAGTSSVFQSTLFNGIAVLGVIPDISLIVILYTSNQNGSLTGQLSGFFAGIVEDFLSLSPLGFHALYKTVIGFICGKTKDTVFIDPVLMPMLIVLIGTILKGAFVLLISLFFSIPPGASNVFSSHFWIEIIYNTVLAPFVFALLGMVKPIKADVRER